MTAIQYLVALALSFTALGGAFLAAWALRAHLLPDWSGARARLAEAVLTLSLVLLCAQGLGVLGLLGRPGLVGLLVLAGALGASRRPWRIHRPAGSGSPEWIPLAACVLGCTLVGAVWISRTFTGLSVGMGGTDTLWFHMPFAAAFAQSGSVVSLLNTDTEFAIAFYPANSELLHATGMVLFGTDLLSPVLNLAWLALLLLACWCAGSRKGVGPLTCLGGAAVATLPMLATTQPGDAKNDILGLACLAASAALLLDSGGRRPAMALSGLAAGVAVGTKLNLIPPAILLLGVVVAIAPTGRTIRASAVWVAALLVPAILWTARNLLSTGNPLPYVRDLGPVHLPGPAAAPQADTGFAVVHYLGDPGLWGEFFRPGLDQALGPAWWLVLGVAAGGLAAGVGVRGARAERSLALAAIGAGVAYLFTPQTAAGPEGMPYGFGANLRYLAPTVLFALLVAPLAAARAGRGRQIALLAPVVVLVGGLADGAVFPAGSRITAILAAILLVGAATAAAVAAWRRAWRPAICAGLGAGVIALALYGWTAQQRYFRDAYTRATPPFTSWAEFGMAPAFAWAKGVTGARIGVVGMTGGFWQYPFTGDGRRNSVSYVGAHGGSGSFTAIEDCRSWRRALSRGRYDYVVTTPRLDPWRLRPRASPPEAGWTAGDPAAVRVAGRRPVLVYKLSGPLSPSGCG